MAVKARDLRSVSARARSIRVLGDWRGRTSSPLSSRAGSTSNHCSNDDSGTASDSTRHADFLRSAPRILAFEGDSHVEWFAGNLEEYESDKIRRLGQARVNPKPR